MKVLGLSQQFIVTVGVMLLFATGTTILASLILFNLALAPLVLVEGALAVTCLVTSDTRFVTR